MEGFWFLGVSDIVFPFYTSHNAILIQVLKADSHPDRYMCVYGVCKEEKELFYAVCCWGLQSADQGLAG